MRKLTDVDLTKIIGTGISGYTVEIARVKCGNYTDSNCYGIILGKNSQNHYVTWQFHLLDDDAVSAYWGHYFAQEHEAAVLDYNSRDLGVQTFEVKITETLELTVQVETTDRQQAEHMVSDKWRSSEYILSADNFVGVKFKAVLKNNTDIKYETGEQNL